MINILFDTDKFDPMYLSNIKYLFLKYIEYRYRAHVRK